MNIRKSPLSYCLFPVFANSMKHITVVEQYGQIFGKTSRLLEFGEKKGFDYDQILDSKPGISIAGEIVTLYKNEMGSSSFEKMLKKSLDETLVKNISTIENEQDLNIEDAMNMAYREFNKYLSGKASRVICPTPN